MNYLIAALRLSIAEALDPYAHLRQMAADKNCILTGSNNRWIVLSADGAIITESKSAVDAIGQLVSK